MGFTRTLWRAIEPIYATILAHPFLRGLTDGSLPHEAFRFYAVQDALYLREFTGDLRPHWAHIDMSAPAWLDGQDGLLVKGATGWGVRMLTRWLSGLSSPAG